MSDKFYYDIEKDAFIQPINDLEGFLDCARYNEEGDVDALLHYLEEHPADINAQDSQSRTAVHMAAANGHVDLLEALAAFQPKVDVGNVEGNTALHFAALNNRLSAAKWLVAKGWHASAKNAFGQTPLQLIYDKKFEKMEELLLEHDDSLDEFMSSGEVKVETAENVEGVEKGSAPTEPARPAKPKGAKAAAKAAPPPPAAAPRDERPALGSSELDGIE
ncbi:hypothetical protein STCU_00539 [Strigomonas culicis]|uniref:Uncharacterized protein n=1 Tax=Strigomonas culicis TaxID=28005 RepID=S9V0A3_9TRYP|nr:hypothetical protein STCU_00759 [Strigomonas culicis]EPY36522.1 hypothetical protein STCU_00539 [Strigomonas culicis]|eukprot:EPY36092.1 hypothetical protein STCU_00759 [Strigomonas culicis]